MRTWPPVSVFMCVRNEAAHIATAIRSVLDQDYPGPTEVVVAVGPSSDATQRIVEELGAADNRVRIVPNPTGRTPDGLNLAVSKTSFDVLARVDGHSMLPPDYLRTAVTVLEQTGASNVGGMMAAEGVTPFERAVARGMTSRLGVGGARFHTGGPPGEVDTVYLGVFRRAALEAAGGYDESFTRAQDWELNYRIRQAGGVVYFTPDLRVSYRPRSTARLLAHQYFNYGRWRREVMRQHPSSVTPRYLVPPAMVAAVAAGLAVGVTRWRPALLAPAGYLVTILGGSVLTGRGLPRRARVLLPVAYATMHFSWGVGFLFGASEREGQPGSAQP